MTDPMTGFTREDGRWRAPFGELTALIEQNELRIYRQDGMAVARFPLAPRISGGVSTLGELRQDAGMLRASLQERPEVEVQLWARDGRLYYRLHNPFDGEVDLGYFPQSTFHGPVWQTFVPDDEDRSWAKSTPQRVTVAMALDRAGETLAGKTPTWMLTPAPRACALEYDGGWLAVMAPQPLPVASTTFSVDRQEQFEISFACYRMPNMKHFGPTVVIAGGLLDPYEALDMLAIVETELHAPTRAPASPWWVLPVFHTWGEQVREAQDINQVGLAQTAQRVRAWSDELSARLGTAGFTVALSEGWYGEAGDFTARTGAYGDDAGLRDFIRQMRRSGHRILLTLPPFALSRASDVVAAHAPNGFVTTDEGDPLTLSGAPLVRDFTYPPMREQFRAVVHRLLAPAGLDADGLLLSGLYQCPDPRVARVYDPSWGVGDELGFRVMELIAAEARAAKADAQIAGACVMPYLQRHVGVVALQESAGAGVERWWRRARVVSRALPGTLLDFGVWPLSREDANAHWMTLPVYSVPSLYRVAQLDDGTPLTTEDFNLITATWLVYANAPVWNNQRIALEPELDVFKRYYPDGTLAAQCIGQQRVLITQSPAELRACASTEHRVELPIMPHQRVLEAQLVSAAGEVIPLDIGDANLRPLPITVPDARRAGHYVRLLLQAEEIPRAA